MNIKYYTITFNNFQFTYIQYNLTLKLIELIMNNKLLTLMIGCCYKPHLLHYLFINLVNFKLF